MAAQIKQVLENIRTAPQPAPPCPTSSSASVAVRKFADACFANIDARMEHGGDHQSTGTTVEVRRLSHPDFLIEVEVMAVIPER